ncbi:MAG: hypothetical protein NC320_01980 [Clostridium sp.]|nr:hypothetical protein [Clostridium sp.]
MIYKNVSHATKTFHGVEFNPSDVKEVDGYINYPGFIRSSKSELNEFNKPTASAKKSSKTTAVKEEVKSDGTNSDK